MPGATPDPGGAPATGSPTDAFVEGPDEPTQVGYQLETVEGSEEISVAWSEDRFALVRGDGRIIREGTGQVIFCTQGPTPGEDICWDLEDRGDPFLQRVATDLLAVYGLAELLPDTAEDLGTEDIAGRPARCVGFTPGAPTEGASPGAGDRTVFCYEEATGIGLRLAVPAGETTQTLEAVSVGTPDDGVFEPTGPVQPYPEEGVSPGTGATP